MKLYEIKQFGSFLSDCRGKAVFIAFKSHGRTMSLQVKMSQLKQMLEYEGIKQFSAEFLSSTVFVSDFK